MAQERAQPNTSRHDTHFQVKVPANSNLALCLRATSLAEAALSEMAATSGSDRIDKLCRDLHHWRRDACQTYILDQDIRKGTTEAEHKIPEKQSPQWEDVLQEIAILKNMCGGESNTRAATLALRAASELVEFAGYSLAQTQQTRDVVPTFLLAQTLMQKSQAYETLLSEE